MCHIKKFIELVNILYRKELLRQNYTRDAFNPGDEVMRRMMSGMSESGYDQMLELQTFFRTSQDERWKSQFDREMQQLLQRGDNYTQMSLSH